MPRLSVLLFAVLSACSSSSDAPVATPRGPLPSPHLDVPRPAPVGPIEPTLAVPEPSGVIYELYVRSFQDSDGDGTGDLQGARQRLDHLAGLGVETIWLMPVFPAYGPAGYDVTDFDRITDEYGTPDDLRELVTEAHALGMRVILDLPLNHVHRSHPWFESVEASGRSPYRDWFLYQGSNPGDGRWFPSERMGYYYAYFGSEMPDLNWDNAEVYDQMVSVMDAWLDAGADGYRLDAVLMLVEQDGVVEGSDASHALVADLLAHARERRPDAWFLAEASEWDVDRAVSWLGSDEAPEADAVLDFPRRDALLEAVESRQVGALIDVVNTEVEQGGAAQMATFLGSHDVDRLPDLVEDPRARRALRVAQMLLPGTPVLYYGDEIDLANSTVATGQDYVWRGPMQWNHLSNAGFTLDIPWFSVDPSYQQGRTVAGQINDRSSMLSLIRDLSCVRAQHGLDGDGSWHPLRVNSASALAFTRHTAEGSLLVVVNLSDAPVPGLQVQTTGVFQDLATDQTVRGSRELDLGVLPAWGYRVLSGGARGTCQLWDAASEPQTGG